MLRIRLVVLHVNGKIVLYSLVCGRGREGRGGRVNKRRDERQGNHDNKIYTWVNNLNEQKKHRNLHHHQSVCIICQLNA